MNPQLNRIRQTGLRIIYPSAGIILFVSLSLHFKVSHFSVFVSDSKSLIVGSLSLSNRIGQMDYLTKCRQSLSLSWCLFVLLCPLSSCFSLLLTLCLSLSSVSLSFCRSLSLCLFVSLSLCLFVSLSLCLFVTLSLSALRLFLSSVTLLFPVSFSLKLCLFVYLCLSVTLYLPITLFLSLCECLPLCVSQYISVSLLYYVIVGQRGPIYRPINKPIPIYLFLFMSLSDIL